MVVGTYLYQDNKLETTVNISNTLVDLASKVALRAQGVKQDIYVDYKPQTVSLRI